MEEWSNKLLVDENPLLSYLVDTVASVTAENVTNVLHDHIGIKMRAEGKKITNRYCPGFRNWSVSGQQKLFSFFPKDFFGVSLKESSLMIPIKSVSGIIGIDADVKRIAYICNTCGIKDCTYRTIRESLAEHFINKNQALNL